MRAGPGLVKVSDWQVNVAGIVVGVMSTEATGLMRSIQLNVWERAWSKGVVSCCRGSCCSWDKRTATTVVDVMGDDTVNEMTKDEDKTSDNSAAADNI